MNTRRVNLDILTEVYGFPFDKFPLMADELKSSGTCGVVVDLSSVPEKEKTNYMSVLMGVFLSRRIEARYLGVKREEVGKHDWGAYRGTALATVQPNLELAVLSFNLLQ